MRKAAYAGLFYPKSVNALNKLIEECFTAKLGPGELPGKPDKNASLIKAVIVPHAGYVYSGMAAAWAYKELAEATLPDLFILLGPNHNSSESGISLESFETPLGLVRADQEFGKALAAKGCFKVNEKIHSQEHSLEVQLPFLQFSFGSRLDGVKILTILVSHDLDLTKAALDLKETIMDLNRKVTFIVSSDFTHQGPNYGYVPFGHASFSNKDSGQDSNKGSDGDSGKLKENLSKLDKGAIALIQKGDSTGFEKYVKETGATICGFLPIILLLKTISSKKVSLEQYYTSGDIANDYTNSVSYASVVFR